MKKLLVMILAISAGTIFNEDAFGDNTLFDSIKFIQYLDENTALEEVRNGNLDLYYYRISSDRLETPQSREGLQVFDSTGGSYSILVNPAQSGKFNPFQDREVRFSLNYLVDRKLIVNELMGGYGASSVSYYSISDPEYLTVIEQLEEFNFRYNPALADKIISKNLVEKGAVKEEGLWTIDSKPIEITIFIRSDDPVRKSIGEILSAELETIGFKVNKEFGDLNKAFVIVYGSNPSELEWNLYTEGWSRSAFVRYDSSGLGQMYAPWFSNMPGFNDPTYWNYKNEKLDELTQKIYTGDFTSEKERSILIQDAVVEGVNDSVRIFLASKVDQYIANESLEGIINDFGAGVPTRFTPINVRGDTNELAIGVKQIYQGSWNPVMGLTDSYSRHIWGVISDPGVFKHPFNGETIPVRAQWQVETGGPNEKLDVPNEAILWDPSSQKWKNVKTGTHATSKVTWNFEFSRWHNGQMMDINDIIHSLYFTLEWGTQTGKTDKTFDTEFTPRAAQNIQSIVGINPIDHDTLEIYVNYWHFDKGEIANWAILWSSIPLEILSAMEQAVVDGKTSFSRSGATSKNVSWLSLITPNDANMIKEYLQDFREEGHVPIALRDFNKDSRHYNERYSSSIDWIEDKNHAVISNGPFYLENYSPESRTITIKSHQDKTYPFEYGHWSDFETIEIPKISNIDMKKSYQKGEDIVIGLDLRNTDFIKFFLTDNKGNKILSKSMDIKENENKIVIESEHTKNLSTGGNNLKIFAISNSVLKPDFYESGFVATDSTTGLPANKLEKIEFLNSKANYEFLLIIPIILLGVLIVIYLKKQNHTKP